MYCDCIASHYSFQIGEQRHPHIPPIRAYALPEGVPIHEIEDATPIESSFSHAAGIMGHGDDRKSDISTILLD